MPHKPTVLLIEDDPDQILMYRTKFELEGFLFLSTQKGRDGIELAKTKHPDLILLDLVLIGENGLDVLRQLKRNDATKNIPAVILTNLVKNDAVEKAQELGAADFLVKTDIVPSDIVQRVRRILKVSHA